MGVRKLTGGAGPVLGAENATLDPASAQVVTALMRMYDGTAWQRVRSADGDASTAVTLLGVQPMLRNDASALFNPPRQARTNGASLSEGVAAVCPHVWDGVSTFQTVQVPGDGRANDNVLPSAVTAFNGATWDRRRNNAEVTVLASASNAAGTRTSADQTNFNARGVFVYLNITALGAAETLTLLIDGKDPVSGDYPVLTAFAGVTADAAYTLYPGALETAAVAAHEVQGLVLPRTWRVRVTTSPGVNASTFSVGASYVL